jgi:hypothetical protein
MGRFATSSSITHMDHECFSVPYERRPEIELKVFTR